MELFEGQIEKLDYRIIIDEIKRGKKGYNLLKTIDFEFKSIIFLVIISVIFSLFLFNITWSNSIVLLIAIVAYSTLTAVTILSFETKYLYYNKDVILIYKDSKFLYFPLKEFLTYKYFATNTQKQVTLYFKNGKSFDFFYKGEIDLFIATLLQTSKASQEGLIPDNKYNLLELFNSVKQNSRLNKYAVKKFVKVVGIIAIILFISSPFMLDRNDYKEAVKTNTASSFRGYLNDHKNFIFRAEVKNLLFEKYNSFINQYKSKYSNSYPIQSLVKLLEYLRDNNIDEVKISFQNFNEIKDNKTNYYVVSVRKALTQQFILDREKELIKTLNQTIGKVFPTDIFSLDESLMSSNIPSISITYSYTNSDATYYNSNEEKLDELKRTYYYGILISWDFKIFLPDRVTPLYSFSLESTPSPTFQSQGRDEGSVYAYMIYSAFDNFAKAYENHFFK